MSSLAHLGPAPEDTALVDTALAGTDRLDSPPDAPAPPTAPRGRALVSRHHRHRPARGASWRPALRYCLLVFVLVRLALLALGLLTVSLLPSQHPVGVPGWPAQVQTPGWHNAVTGWERADSLWFLRIAATGYRPDDGSAAFFPLFPMTVRAVAWLAGGRFLLAGFLVSNGALLAGLVLLFKLTAEQYTERFARRTVLYLCLFPTAFFLFAPFSESLFLACAVGSLYAARHQRWLLAGGVGAAAALTRSIGLALCLVLAVQAWSQWRGRGQGPVRSRSAAQWVAVLACCALPAAGTVGYLAFWQWRGPGWQTPLRAQGGWDRHLSAPWRTLWHGVLSGTGQIGAYPGGYWTTDLLLVALALALAVWVARRTQPVFAVYTGLCLLFPLLFMFDGRPLMSMPRFLLPVFPLFWGLARFAERFRAHDLVIAVSSASLAVIGALAISWQPIF